MSESCWLINFKNGYKMILSEYVYYIEQERRGIMDEVYEILLQDWIDYVESQNNIRGYVPLDVLQIEYNNMLESRAYSLRFKLDKAENMGGVKVKATYDNSFCMDSKCINYFEDMCMLCMAETGDEIVPYNLEYIDRFGRGKSSHCKSFIAGTNIGYIEEVFDKMEEVAIKAVKI